MSENDVVNEMCLRLGIEKEARIAVLMKSGRTLDDVTMQGLEPGLLMVSTRHPRGVSEVSVALDVREIEGIVLLRA